MSEKSLIVEPTGSGLYRIKYTGGGDVPKELQGKYTSYTDGRKAIALHQKSVQASPYIKYPKDKEKKAEPKNAAEGKD